MIKYAFYIGGPADGRRDVVDGFPREVRVAFLYPTPSLSRPVREADTVRVDHAIYRLLSPPVNPARVTGGSHALDAEIGVYHVYTTETL